MPFSDEDIYTDFAEATGLAVNRTKLLDGGSFHLNSTNDPRNAEYCSSHYKNNRAKRMAWQREYYARNRESHSLAAAARYAAKKLEKRQ